MNKKICCTATLLVALLCLTWVLLAGYPQFWEFDAQEEFLKGKLHGVSLTSDGKIILSPHYESIFETGQAYLFSIAGDRKGNLYVGSGHEGKVFKIHSQRNGDLFFKAKELDIYALAVDSQNNLYVGSSPDGKVYKVSPDGTSKEFFDPSDKYIWAMVLDKEDNLYVATGGRGLIYKVKKNGEGKVFFESQETHIMSLTLDLAGNLIAGSAPNGYIYRISSEGKGFVLYDSDLSEVRSLAVDRYGNIYAAALNESSSGWEAPSPLSKSVSSTVLSAGKSSADTRAMDSAAHSQSELKPTTVKSVKSTAGLKSAIYQISKDGSVETLWTSKESVVYSLLIREDGNLLASTGTKGRILSMSPRRTVTILVESSEEQVISMLARGNEVYAASSNLGKVFAMRPERTQQGYYESEVKDAKTIASWGVIRWRIGNGSNRDIEIYTRTGNTEKPNKTWSDWVGPYKTPEGEQIKSPRARYIQWRAVFKGGAGNERLISEDNALERVSIAFLQQNMRPRVAAINILTPGIALQKLPTQPTTPQYTVGEVVSTTTASTASPSVPAPVLQPPSKFKFKPPPQQRPQPGARSITWKAEDDNEDELQYEIYFKAEGEQDWKLLEKNLKDEFYTFDSTTLPDGVYYIKVVASDAPSNPYGKALAGELVSKPFIIDNTPPVVEIVSHKVSGKKVEVSFRVKDNVSNVLSAEYSIDGGEWRAIFPKDGIADSKTEEYQFITEDLNPGEHTVALKGTDAMGNTGSNKLVLKISK